MNIQEYLTKIQPFSALLYVFFHMIRSKNKYQSSEKLRNILRIQPIYTRLTEELAEG